jgi:hypothetical protein
MRKYETLQTKKAVFEGYKVSVMDLDGEEYKKLIEGIPATGQSPCIGIINSKEIPQNAME